MSPDLGVRERDELERLELAVSGVICASCGVRVERTLGRPPGVEEASVKLRLRTG